MQVTNETSLIYILGKGNNVHLKCPNCHKELACLSSKDILEKSKKFKTTLSAEKCKFCDFSFKQK